MQLDLYQIEQSLRSQFVWKKKRKKVGETETDFQLRIANIHSLSTDEEHETHENMALIVFCALSDMYGFDNREVVEYLGIEEFQLRQFRKLYSKHMEQAIKIKKDGGVLNPASFMGKLYTKMGLVRNYIHLNYPEGLVKLSDLP